MADAPIESDRVRFDLPQRFVAGFGCIGVTLSGILAAVARLFCDRFRRAHPGHFDQHPRAVAHFFGVGWIAAVYILGMATSAFMLALRQSLAVPGCVLSGWLRQGASFSIWL